MAEDHNPYQPPRAGSVPAPQPAGETGVTPAMVQLLSETRPWTLFLAVLGLLFSGLIGVAGVLFGVTGALAEQGLPIGGLAMALVYLVMSALYSIPAVLLLRFSAHAKRVRETGSSVAFEDALRSQRNFWRVIGIVTLVLFGLYFLAILLVVLVGVAALGF